MMRAIIVDPERRTGMRFANVPEPIPTTRQLLIEVQHISLNPGEIHQATGGALPPNLVLGWEAAGVVISAAHDPGESGRTSSEYGPTIGDRVITYGRHGGWAQRRTATVDNLAIVPDYVDLAAAAALPVAACTALGALQAAGPVLGRRVLITGASGGVGRFAVQLAAIGGAYVIASVGSEIRGKGLPDLGAHEVVVGLDGITEPVDVVLEAVGGPHLVKAFGLLAPGGVLQSYGGISNQPAVFPPYSTVGPPRSLMSFALPPSLAVDLTVLIELLSEGKLTVEIGWRGPWERHADAIDALRARQVNGKAILDVS